jgi:peptidoglycan/LPS O-acetylase OafA/YrhL
MNKPGATPLETVAAPPRGGSLPWLDWLRFLAAFEVVAVHARGGSLPKFEALPAADKTALVKAFFIATRLGEEAVLFFFVLSGFFVGGRLIERTTSGKFKTGDYAIDRATRIWVPLIPALVLTWLANLAAGEHPSPGSFLGNLAGLQTVATDVFGGNAPLWSLAFETWFYVLGGAAAHLATRRGTSAGAALAFLGSLCLFTRLDYTFLLCWIVGAFAWVARPATARPAWLGVAAALLLAGGFSIEASFDPSLLHGELLQRLTPDKTMGRLLFSAGACALIQFLSALTPRSDFARRLDGTGTRLAAFSYSLYLCHLPLIQLAGAWGMPTQPGFTARGTFFLLGKTAVATAGSFAMYLVFERRTADVRSWLRARFR